MNCPSVRSGELDDDMNERGKLQDPPPVKDRGVCEVYYILNPSCVRALAPRAEATDVYTGKMISAPAGGTKQQTSRIRRAGGGAGGRIPSCYEAAPEVGARSERWGDIDAFSQLNGGQSRSPLHRSSI